MVNNSSRCKQKHLQNDINQTMIYVHQLLAEKNSNTQTDISEDEIAKVYEISWSSSRSVTPDAGQSNFPKKRPTFHRNVIAPVAKETGIQLEVFLLTTSSSAIRKLARAAGRVSAGTTRRKKRGRRWNNVGKRGKCSFAVAGASVRWLRRH